MIPGCHWEFRIDSLGVFHTKRIAHGSREKADTGSRGDSVESVPSGEAASTATPTEEEIGES